MPARSTIECDIRVVGEVAMAAFDEGVAVEVLYWTMHRKVACVVSSQEVRGFALASTPVEAVTAAVAQMWSGL